MSRKIVALVAERAMGWKREVQRRTIVGYRDDKGEYRIIEGMAGVANVWDPSTDIAAAWEVVEKMRIDGWDFSMLGKAPLTPPRTSMPSDKDPKNRFRFHNLMHQPPKDPDGADEATMPLAICVAALRAVGVTDVEILAAMDDGRAQE